MTPRLFRFGLSLFVVLVCWIGRTQAQSPDPTVPQLRVFAPLANLIGPPTPVAGQTGDRMLHQSYKCGQHHDWYGCGGWHSQNVFVFGSCRRFFGEVCPPADAGERLFGNGQGRGFGGGLGGAFGGGCPGGCNK